MCMCMCMCVCVCALCFCVQGKKERPTNVASVQKQSVPPPPAGEPGDGAEEAGLFGGKGWVTWGR